MKTKILILRHRPTTYEGGMWEPDKAEQEAVFKHFSGGYVGIPHSRLDELLTVADLHGWSVASVKDEKGG